MASSRSDQELLDLWRRGDQAAGDELHARYYDMLLDFFASTVTAAKMKVELVVDTFIACRDERSQLVPNLSLGVHLLNIAGRVLRASRARWERRSSLSSSSRIEQAMGLVSVENRKLIELHDFTGATRSTGYISASKALRMRAEIPVAVGARGKVEHQSSHAAADDEQHPKRRKPHPSPTEPAHAHRIAHRRYLETDNSSC